MGMIDREKVINGLRYCLHYGSCLDCPYAYDGPSCQNDVLDDALALLKEQEPKFVEIDGQLGGIKYGRCPKCGKGLNEEVYPHWCGFCGQAVRWNKTLKSEPDTLEPLVRLFDD